MKLLKMEFYFNAVADGKVVGTGSIWVCNCYQLIKKNRGKFNSICRVLLGHGVRLSHDPSGIHL